MRLRGYILARVAQFVPVTLVVIVLNFLLIHLAPGDVSIILAGETADPAYLAAIRERYGLDRPFLEQLWRYLVQVASGDLGLSFRSREPVMAEIMSRVPATLLLVGTSLVLAVVLGVAIGTWIARRPGSALDSWTSAIAVALFSVPVFWLGLMLVLLFAVRLNWLPSGGADSWTHGILPVITLGTAGAAIIARFTRSAMLEVLGQPYVRAALAKGVPWRGVVWRHALPNAAIPTVTIIGFMVGTLIAGAVVVESVFSWPGVGRMLVVGVANRDLAVVQCILLLVAACMVTSNFTVDLLYGWIDPRLRSRATVRAGS